MSSDLPTPYVPCLRVTQLDAADLDDYLVQLLVRQQFEKCVKFLFPKYVNRIKPELQTLLYGTLLYCTVGKLHQTVGQKLFGVMLADSRNLGPVCKKKIYCLMALELFIFWWKTRYNDVYPSVISSHPRLAKVLDVFITVTKLLEICNFLMFLRKGEFNRALLRILGLRVVFDHPNPVASSISYTILSREILWRGFAESTLYFLTILDLPRIKKYFQGKFGPFKEMGTKPDLTKCGICGDWPSQPYGVNCGHVFCYYCAATAVSAKSTCPICDSLIESLLGPKKVSINANKNL